jgi:hypothetical protein
LISPAAASFAGPVIAGRSNVGIERVHLGLPVAGF